MRHSAAAQIYLKRGVPNPLPILAVVDFPKNSVLRDAPAIYCGLWPCVKLPLGVVWILFESLDLPALANVIKNPVSISTKVFSGPADSNERGRWEEHGDCRH